MAASEATRNVELTLADVESCQTLSDEAGWNQTADDWRLFISRGQSIGVKTAGGTLVASAAALPYDRFGFVSMVLVTAAWRRRGLATALVNQCVDHLKSRGLTPVLDATPPGALVYRQQGFAELFALDRWQRGPEPVSSDGATELPPADLELMRGLDREAGGADRLFLLADFADREGSRTFAAPSGTGFAIVRRGRRAMQVGPVVAASASEALRLLSAVLAGVSEAIFIDVPSIWKEVADWLRERGFTLQRSFTRMAHGCTTPFGRPDRLFAVAGPEFG